MVFQFRVNCVGDDNIKIQLFQNRVCCQRNDGITGFPDLLMCWRYLHFDACITCANGAQRNWRQVNAVVICRNSNMLAVSTDVGRAPIFSFQYKIHTHNILYTYYKVQLHAFRILRILQQIYYLCIFPKIFFVLLFPEQKNCQSSKFQAI